MNKGTKINKHLFVWLFSLVLGSVGLDRFIRGQIGTGVCKLLFNWLTLNIWALVDFLIACTKAYGQSYCTDKELVFDEKGHYIK